MKIFRRIALGWSVVVFVVSATALPKADPVGWGMAWPVKNDGNPAGFVRLELTPAVVDGCRPDLADLRLVPRIGPEELTQKSDLPLTPFMIHRVQVGEEDVEVWKPANMINRVFEPGQYEQVVLDFGKPTEKNRLRVKVSGENFRRRVMVEGSDDNQTWKVVREDAWLFNISQPSGNYDVNTVEFPPNDFQYLRVTVYHMTDDPRRLEIKEAETLFYRVEPDVHAPVPLKSWDMSSARGNVTELVIDVGYRNLPLSRVALTVDGTYFHRGYELLGRNGETERIERKTETGWDETERDAPWNPIARGVIYRVREGHAIQEKASVDDFVGPYRYLKLRIFNGDNEALKVRKVSVERRLLPWVVFENDPAQPLSLLSANSRATAPDFDFAVSVRDLAIASLPNVELGDTPVKLKPESEEGVSNTLLIWLALIVAVLAVLALIMSNLRKLHLNDLE